MPAEPPLPDWLRGDKPRILLVVHRGDWIHATDARQVATRLADMGDFRVCALDTDTPPAECDLIVAFRPENVVSLRTRSPRLHLHVTAHVGWRDATGGLTEAVQKVVARATSLSAVNGRLREEVEQATRRRVHLCPSGVDMERFTLRAYPETFTAGWAGNSRADGGTDLKGLPIIEEACRLAGMPLKVADRHDAPVPFEQMPDWYGGISVLLCASLAEGTPNPVLEALACGRPVISTDVGIVREALASGAVGEVVERTPEAFARSLTRLREQWPPSDDFSSRCREAASRWAWERVVGAWRDTFVEALQIHVPAPKPLPAPASMPAMDRVPVQYHKPHILLVADVPGWAFDVNLRDLAAYLGDEFQFAFWYTRDYRGAASVPDLAEFDGVFVPFHRWHFNDHVPKYKALGSLRSRWFRPEAPGPATEEDVELVNSFRGFHVVTRANHDEIKGRCPGAVYLTNPVNMRRFKEKTEVKNRLVACWSGNGRHHSPLGEDVKGLTSIIRQACKFAGVPLEVAEYHSSRLSAAEMPAFYRRANVYLCASLYEGASNSVMEAMAAGQALITTDCGNVREMQEQQLATYGESGIIVVDRSVRAFTEALGSLSPERALEMGAINRRSIRDAWSWAVWTARYRDFLQMARC